MGIESGLPLGVYLLGLIVCGFAFFWGYSYGLDKAGAKGYSKGYCKGYAQGYPQGWVERHYGKEMPEWAANVDLRGWTHVTDLSDFIALEAGGFPKDIASDDDEVISGQQKRRNE